MTPRTQASSEATERGSVQRMISWTCVMGSAYSSSPSEKTTSWRVDSVDMGGPLKSGRGDGCPGSIGHPRDDLRVSRPGRTGRLPEGLAPPEFPPDPCHTP